MAPARTVNLTRCEATIAGLFMLVISITALGWCLHSLQQKRDQIIVQQAAAADLDALKEEVRAFKQSHEEARARWEQKREAEAAVRRQLLAELQARDAALQRTRQALAARERPLAAVAVGGGPIVGILDSSTTR